MTSDKKKPLKKAHMQRFFKCYCGLCDFSTIHYSSQQDAWNELRWHYEKEHKDEGY